MSKEMKQLFTLIEEIGLRQLLTFEDGTIIISANGNAILANFDNAKVVRDDEFYHLVKVTAQVGNVSLYGYLTDSEYIKYLESKVA